MVAKKAAKKAARRTAKKTAKADSSLDDTESHTNAASSSSNVSTSSHTQSTASTKASALNLQPALNIGLVGHVDHGKTTLTERLSGKWTDTHSEEMKRGITIRLGYADTTFYKTPGKNGPDQYSTKPKDADSGSTNEPVLKVSFVDAPGHEALMATMLAGTTIMDGALLLVAANERCPQPQTREHIMALQMAGVKNVIVVQNKIDLVPKERAIKNYQQIKEFLATTVFKDAPIIPISAQRGVNIDVLIQAIIENFPVPKRDSSLDPLMFVARSFDVNKPGWKPEQLVGGVLGGSLKQGIFKVGDVVELRPGRIFEEANKLKATPLRAKITGAMTGGSHVDSLGPGGSIAIMTSLDPSIVKGDALTGSVVGLPEKLPPTWYSLRLKAELLERVVGSSEDLKVNPIIKNEILMLNVNSAATVGVVRDLGKGIVSCELKKPVCAALGSRVTISRRIGTRFRLIGFGEIVE